MTRTLLILTLSLTACGLDPAKIASHRIFISDTAEFVADGPLQFAVVGNTRQMHPTIDRGALGHGGVTHALVGDIIAASLTGGPDFAVLAGDLVRSSSNSEWQDFDDQFVGLLDGATAPPVRTQRIPSVAVAGDREAAGDPAYQGLEASFPGTGTSIGHGRVATWSHFDVRSKDSVWRFLVLDSGQESLGSRWREQLTWIPGAVQGSFTGIIVLVHEPALSLGGSKRGSAATQALLDAVDEVAPMDSVKAVISAGPSVSQALLPEGILGALHVGAGGGGAPAQDLHRTAPGPKGQAIVLAKGFDQALQRGLRGWSGAAALSDRTVERAAISGAFKGTAGVYDAGEYPTYGWWLGEIDGPSLKLTWRRWQPDGTFKNTWSVRYTRQTGWTETP